MMAEAKPGDKRCDRCDMYAAVKQTIARQEGDRKAEGVVYADLVVDLCTRCGKIVDNAIKRAVKPK